MYSVSLILVLLVVNIVFVVGELHEAAVVARRHPFQALVVGTHADIMLRLFQRQLQLVVLADEPQTLALKVVYFLVKLVHFLIQPLYFA